MTHLYTIQTNVGKFQITANTNHLGEALTKEQGLTDLELEVEARIHARQCGKVLVPSTLKVLYHTTA